MKSISNKYFYVLCVWIRDDPLRIAVVSHVLVVAVIHTQRKMANLRLASLALIILCQYGFTFDLLSGLSNKFKKTVSVLVYVGFSRYSIIFYSYNIDNYIIVRHWPCLLLIMITETFTLILKLTKLNVHCST